MISYATIEVRLVEWHETKAVRPILLSPFNSLDAPFNPSVQADRRHLFRFWPLTFGVRLIRHCLPIFSYRTFIRSQTQEGVQQDENERRTAQQRAAR